jgi:hypothetical protein
LSPRLLIIIGGLALLVIPATLLLFYKPQPPHVTATFHSVTNLPRSKAMIFVVTNHSTLLIHCVAFQSLLHSKAMPLAAVTIDPGSSGHVTIPYLSDSLSSVELCFRRRDTTAEEAREMLDSIFKSIGIRWPGLNPELSANLFTVTAAIPDEKSPSLPERVKISSPPTLPVSSTTVPTSSVTEKQHN